MKAAKPVAFLAMLTSDVTVHHQNILFDDVKLNIGNAYNPIHGNFIAPFNGSYLFTVSACSENGHFVVLDFHVNTLVYDKVLAGDTQINDCSSKTILVSLTINDDVFVKHEQTGDYLNANPAAGFPSFGGVLLSGA